jgi:IstB-like ATP binding protein
MSKAQTIAVLESGEWLVRVSPLVQMGYSAELGRSRLAANAPAPISARTATIFTTNRASRASAASKAYSRLHCNPGDRSARIPVRRPLSGAHSPTQLAARRSPHSRKLPATAAEDLLEIVMRRYEHASTLLTSNRPVEDWGKLLGDSAAVTAMLDRLLHHGQVLKCRPRSWRTKTDLPPREAAG